MDMTDSVWLFFYPCQIKLINNFLVLRLLFCWNARILLKIFNLYLDRWCHIVTLLLLIFFYFDHVENFNERIFISRNKSLIFLVFCDLFRLLPSQSCISSDKGVDMSEVTATKVAYFSKNFFTLNLLGFFGLCLLSLPWLSDELESNEEHKELYENESKHVNNRLSLYHC